MGTEFFAVGFTILFTIATSGLLGRYMYHVFTGKRTLLDPVLVPIERLVLRLTGVDTKQEQDWKQYSISLLISNVFMWLATWTIVTLQQYLPLNPDGIVNMEPTLAFNTISSFTTNTNLQHYSGETGLSYFSQMFTISFLQFVTAATGVAAAVAIIRGLAGNRLKTLGNFYVDLTRATVRLFLPLAVVVSVLMMWQGTPMTFEGAAKATTVEGQEQTIARGVTAGVVSIKQLGTNGGGYFGPNSAHPYENPTPLVQLHRAVVDHGHPDVDGRDARIHGRASQAGGRHLRDDARALHPDGDLRCGHGRRWQPCHQPHGRRSVHRLHGRQGGPSRVRAVRALVGDDDGDVERVGQRDARLADAARRSDAAHRHVAQQHLRRRRRRLHQHADLRHRRGVRRRHDDRPDTGVPRQEGRSQGDEAGQSRACSGTRWRFSSAPRSPATSGRRRPIRELHWPG